MKNEPSGKGRKVSPSAKVDAKMFKFDSNVRPMVVRILKVMEWANLQDSDEARANDGHSIYASQRNVFGHMYNAVLAIIVEECGREVAAYAEREFNWGGQVNWLEDCELAVQIAIDRVEFEKQISSNEVK